MISELTADPDHSQTLSTLSLQTTAPTSIYDTLYDGIPDFPDDLSNHDDNQTFWNHGVITRDTTGIMIL